MIPGRVMDRFFRHFPKAQVDSFKVTLVGSGKRDKSTGFPHYPKVEPSCETFYKLKWHKAKSKSVFAHCTKSEEGFRVYEKSRYRTKVGLPYSGVEQGGFSGSRGYLYSS